MAVDQIFGEERLKLGNAILAAADTAGRIDLIESFLLERFPQAISRAAKNLVGLLKECGHQSHSVSSSAEKLAVNQRQLERRMASEVGLAPKQYLRIVRFQKAASSLLSGRSDSLTEIAHAHEYYDQAHFINEFKTFTGHTPGQFFKDSLYLSRLFYGEE